MNCPLCGEETASLIRSVKHDWSACWQCCVESPEPMLRTVHAKTVDGIIIERRVWTRSNVEAIEQVRDQEPDALWLHCQLTALAPPCRRSNGSFRAYFLTKDAAERFALDPANHPMYLGDVAHACGKCGYFHLSRPEWLLEQMPTGSAMVN